MYPSAYTFSKEFALECDQNDPIASYKNEFTFPQHNGQDSIYLCGNSLGLMPKSAEIAINTVLSDWKTFGVEGHTQASNPWLSYHKQFALPLSKLVGALEHEVVAMNALTVNVHLMFQTFYRPTATRHKILILGQEFPSDRYAAQSHILMHGYLPETSLIEVQPSEGNELLSTDEIIRTIERHADSLCVVHFSAIHYYTGQYFDIPAITAAVHNAGAIMGWDLAHAIGNVPLELHKWDVDYAAWCSYKYLNSSPGGVAGIYVHEKHCKNQHLIRPAGWWGNDESTRFEMPHTFVPVPTAESWQLSNAPVLMMAVHKASLSLFDNIGIENLRRKSVSLTCYLEFVITEINEKYPDHELRIITPRNSDERGAQLSLIATQHGKKIFDTLTQLGVIADWRNPDVIRIAAAPLYNSFLDVYNFGKALDTSLQSL